MSETSHSIGFSNFTWPSAAGPGDAVLPDLQAAAAAGGEAVFDRFATDLAALRELRKAGAGDGGVTWQSGTDTKTGFATSYVAVGDDYLVAGVYPLDQAPAVLTQGSPDKAADLATFYLVMVTGGSSATPVVTQLMSADVSYQGDALQQLATGDGFQSLVKTLVGQATSFVGKMFELAFEGASATTIREAAAQIAGAVDDAGTQAAGPAYVEGPGGSVIRTDVTMTVGEAVSLGLQVVALLAMFALQLLAKQMTSYVRVYNATGEELDVALAWLHEDDGYAGPQGTTFVTLEPLGATWTPAAVIGSGAVSYTGWVVGNTDSLGRIAYVLRIAPTATFPGANVMVDIPNHADNSLAVAVGADDDAQAFWQAHQGRDTDLTASDGIAPSSPYRVRIATNQNSGTSPSPADGQLGYHYEHVVLIEPTT